VPEYIEPGETIKINTSTGKFMSRAWVYWLRYCEISTSSICLGCKYFLA
jgi:hypothetical protein